MILHNLKICGDHIINLRINGELITEVSQDNFEVKNECLLKFDNVIAFPGLINSHDHLDFNLFPRLGEKKYKSYIEWGKYIHKNYKNEINEVLTVPEAIRAKWGIYKNILCGVTTVVNHGKKLFFDETLISVIQSSQTIHSVAFEKFWKLKLNNPFKKNIPCVIHAGEGVDDKAAKEIDTLINWNVLKRELVAVHGVAMSSMQAKHFKGLVWCPDSNYFLLNNTAAVNELKNKTTICFGTDSSLSSSWNIWEHIKLARKLNLVNDEELYCMLNKNPSHLWNSNAGFIKEGKLADIVVAKQKNNSLFYPSFYSVEAEDILLVIYHGKIILFDEELFPQLSKEILHDNFSKIKIMQRIKYVAGNIKDLITAIKKYYPKAILPFSLAG